MLIVLLALGAGPSRAETAVEKLPGYVDLSDLGLPPGTEATVEVNLRGAVLRLIGAASRTEEPGFAEMVDKLRLIRVQVFPLKDLDPTKVQERIAALGSRVEQQGWEKVVQVQVVRGKEQAEQARAQARLSGGTIAGLGEQARVYLKLSGEKIAGLLVMAVDKSDQGGEEVVFVNIVGELDPEQIGRLGQQLNISPLDSVRLVKQP
jgi:hypothetical protein